MTTEADDDPAFGDLLDDLLTQMLDGGDPDLDATRLRHPAAADRLDEALALASATAGRRTQPRPSLQGYEIVRELGRGGMGTVYLARQVSLDREVAIKVLPHSFGLSPRTRQRFLAEARAVAKVVHDHVIGIHRVLDDGEVLAFEMEYIDGPSLQVLLDHLRAVRQTGVAPTLQHTADLLGLPVAALGARTLTQFFVRLAMKIGRALGHVHAAGLIHRDVKPANVLLRRTGEPVLVDFGLARFAGFDATRTGGFAGTQVYSAPEQLRGDRDLGPPADVYGLGVTLYECLALTTPFLGRSTTDQLRRIENGHFVPLRRVAPGTPRDLTTIVAHAMEAEPARRYADGTLFADDLQRLLDLQPVLARPIGPVRRLGKLMRRQRSSLVAGILGAALVIAAMVPILDRVEAASRRRGLARDHLHAGQQHLVSIDTQHPSRRVVATGGAASQALGTQQAAERPLVTALAEYDRALELDPEFGAAERERSVVRLALWLRRLSVPDQEHLRERLDSDEFRALLDGLGPATVQAAHVLARGTYSRDGDDEDLDEVDADDRATLGLLRFLFGDFGRCEDAWQGLPPALREQPLMEAALGLIHHADGRPDLAHVQLQQAQRHFPRSSTLCLALAESALSLGDLPQVRHWLRELAPLPETASVRRRLELDLQTSTLSDQELASGYRELAAADPGDPTPRHRLVMLALRQGDLRIAARQLDALIEEWPGVARYRLDRARLSLQQRDVPAYAEQVLAVLASHYGRRQSRGTTADLLEILRIGGLSTLLREGIAIAGDERSGRAPLGGEIPVRGFAPRLAPTFESLAQAIHDVTRRGAEIERDYRLDGGARLLLVTLPLLAARLPLLRRLEQMPFRALLASTPARAAAAWVEWLPWLRVQLISFWGKGWSVVVLARTPRPPGLPAAAVFGTNLLGVGDLTDDGAEDLLVGCGSTRPTVAESTVVLVDGRSGAEIATLRGESEDNLFGFAMTTIEDVDGDGCEDWLFGAPAGTQETQAGAAEVWSARRRTRLFRLEGDGPGFGVSVAGLGDVDADGTPDFAVATAPMLRNTAAQGSVRICSGRDGHALRLLRNDVPDVWFGAAIARVRDADGDGTDDLVVGGNFGNAPGLVRLYSARTGAILQTWSDPSTSHGLGTSVLGVGDVDGDGRGDVAISAVRTDETSGLDEVFVFSGANGRRLSTIQGKTPGSQFGKALALYQPARGRPLLAVGAPGGGTVEFSTLQGSPMTSVLTPVANNGFGAALAFTKDLDGDDREELAVAAPSDGGVVWRINSRQIRWSR